MKKSEIWHAIAVEMKADKSNNPSFPDHAAGMAGKVVAPAGELMKHAMDFKYGAADYEAVNAKLMEYAAIKTAAMAIRFLENLKQQNDVA